MHRILSLFATLSVSLVSLHASAQPDEGAKLVARELMTKGREQREAHDFNGALESFSKANAIMHVPTTLLEVARAHADLGELMAALGALDQLAREPVSVDDPVPFVRARTEGATLRTELVARLPTLRVDLGGAPDPSSTELWIDGAPRPECTAGCHVDPGSHLVVAESRSARAEEQVQLREGETQPLELVFSPQLRVPVAPDGSVASADSANAIAPDGAAHHSKLSRTTLALGITSLASLGVGGALGMSAITLRNDLERSCGDHCSSGAVQDVRRRAILCDIALGVGATAAALTAVTYVAGRDPSPSGARGVRSGLSVAAAPSAGAYVSWFGAF